MAKLNETQFGKCYHALGLSNENGAYRNYYNSGRTKDKELDELVFQDLMSVTNRGEEMGGYFYSLTSKGISFMSKSLRRNIKEELNRYS